MYLSFFGLNCKPFQLTPDPDFFFLSKEHKKTLTYLSYGIKFNQGFILITGEVGIGKTTIIRKVIKELDDDVRLAKVSNTRVTSDQLCALINDDFGLDTSGKDKTRMLRELTDFLIGEYSAGRRCMLFIDEAQNLSADLLEEIRLLSNLETDKSKLLQIVLVGQPELRKTIARPELRQLRQRINISCHLNALTREETESYIFHRLEGAGNRNAASFETGTLDAVYGFSRGIPRLINIVCDFLFLSAFAEGTKAISAPLVKEVIGEMEHEYKYWNSAEPEEKTGPSGDGMQEMLLRLKKLEITASEKRLDRIAEGKIEERISIAEAALNDAAEKLSAEAARLNQVEKGIQGRFNSLEKEMELLRGMLPPEREKPGNGKKAGSHKKTGLWGRIFK
ncbi:MAG: XrtA-associated ATPase [Nitrospiraceae bacterium]|nr:XrtA-associated ATPase [Nitrospiraceae bacterium]